ncbi:MAG: glycoside hydrolase family 32 protein [Anaerolineae bacterium]|nr:glycoside hydrolase family 32 protein [Candidatus Roseilinea sp.]MDW8448480.1 glycoside hydrolase family 32 protein [Anaerolineae bacterium]
MMLRPRFHFTPPANWLNDPNGLVYFDGEWHLFYQHNPFGIDWGHMSWGHAVSRDFVHWEHLPVALPEQPGYMIFSGSAAVDWANTGGFGDGVRPPLVAAYTAHSPHEQTQHIAFSLDRGRTWTPYAGNPVIAIGSREFRDPKLFWHAPSGRWVMACALADRRQVRFYGSPNLRDWQHLSDFGPAGATAGLWECPDLFPLPVEGDPTQQRWVLKVDDQRCGAQYFVGDFNGERFACDDPPSVRRVDFGKDFYAAQSWNDAPGGRLDTGSPTRRVWLAWMSHWDYAARTPTAPWRGMMSAPRELALRRDDDGLCLVQRPVRELRVLRRAHWRIEDVACGAANDRLRAMDAHGTALEIAATFLACAGSAEFGLKVRVGAAEETVIGYNAAEGQLFVDRSRSGNVSFSPRFAERHAAPCPLRDGALALHVLVDACSVEVFADDGRVVISDLIFPEPESDGIEVFGDGATRVQSLDVWALA